MTPKQIAAERAAELVKNGMTVGLGSGSTATYAIAKIGERVRQGLSIKAVASSRKTEALAQQLLIPVFDPSDVDSIDLAIDGADEVDTKGNLIKGGGGSLLREKIIAFSSMKFHVMVDGSKLVERLGRKAPVPVEIVPFAAALTLRHLQRLGCEPSVRRSNKKDFITDNGNMIVDCKFDGVDDPAWLDLKIKMIPGVVETGLFSSKIVTSIFVAEATGEIREITINS